MTKKIEVQFYSDQIAEAVRATAQAVKAMQNSGLQERAIMALIKGYDSRLTKTNINDVLRALKGMGRYYLKNDD